MDKREQVISDLNALIGKLSVPLVQSEIALGWTPESQYATIRLLSLIRLALIENRPIENVSIGRGLDHWGIEEGPFFEEACKISNALRQLRIGMDGQESSRWGQADDR